MFGAGEQAGDLDAASEVVQARDGLPRTVIVPTPSGVSSRSSPPSRLMCANRDRATRPVGIGARRNPGAIGRSSAMHPEPEPVANVITPASA